MKNVLLVIIVLAVVALGFVLNETATNEAGYDKVSLVKL